MSLVLILLAAALVVLVIVAFSVKVLWWIVLGLAIVALLLFIADRTGGFRLRR